MDLIKLLTEQLGITEAQAKGGAGLIFDLVKKQVSGAEFQQVSQAIPQVQAWMSAAPKEEGGDLWSLAGSLASQLGLGDLGKLAELASGFQKLNLDPALLSKFGPIIFKFIESLGGDQLKAILEKVLAPK